MNAHFNGIWRMDWGLGNPNKTAVLIATLMVASWSLAYIKKWGFAVSLCCFTGLGVCLIQTASRGGLVAGCIGSGILLFKIKWPWDVLRTIKVVFGCLVIVGSSFYFQTYSRYGQGINHEDLSITNRLHIWNAVPRMLLDAPWGWGIGNSGHAYVQWYQPLDQSEKYRTLVNSHLTWLVEFGWPLRFMYLLAWCLTIVLCFPDGKSTLTAIPLGIWIAFGVGAFFSSIAESLWTWIVPTISLVFALNVRFRNRAWPIFPVLLCSASVAIGILLIVTLVGVNNKSTRIHGSSNIVVVGDNPNIWVLVDTKVLGFDFGRAFRQYHPAVAVGFITSRNLPADLSGETLIVCGSLNKQECSRLPIIATRFKKVVFVNPNFFPQECKIGNGTDFHVVFGEYSRSSSTTNWKERFGNEVALLPGIGDFIPDWPRTLLDHGRSF